VSNRARREETRALRRRLLPSEDTISIRIRLQGCERPTRADFARHLVETGSAMIFAPPAPRKQPIKTGRLR
jgi:hypothetical protein